MEYGISHTFEDETIEAKARWFLEKPIEERLREALEDMVFVNKLAQTEVQDDRSTFKTFRVLELKASNRPPDIEDVKILEMARKKK